MSKFRRKIDAKVIQPVLAFLKQGITPSKLAMSLALGFVIGLFPVVGVTTLIGLIVAFALRLNMAALQLVNYLVYPLQLILVIPMIKLGSWMVGVNPIPYSLTEMLEIIERSFMEAIELLGFAHLLGIVSWSIFIVPLGVILYVILFTVLKRLAKN